MAFEIVKSKITNFFNSFRGLDQDEGYEKELTVNSSSGRGNALDKEFNESHEEENKIIIKKRSMLNKLYSLEQLIKTFERMFPNEYQEFFKRIEDLKCDYKQSLDDYIEIVNTGKLTFEVNPEYDGKKNSEFLAIQSDVKNFIEYTFKFEIILRRAQKLCAKLSILYETSIYYNSNIDKSKVLSQLVKAKETLEDIVSDMSVCTFYRHDIQKRDVLVDLISYADYLICKCYLRNVDNFNLETSLGGFVISKNFEGLDCKFIFGNLFLEELNILSELVKKLSNTKYYSILDGTILRFQNLVNEYPLENVILSNNIWNQKFGIEDNVINLINKILGKDQNRLFIDRFGTKIDEDKLFYSVKSQSYIALTDIYYKSENVEFELILKILEKLNDEVTYKEIFFILLLFDLEEEVLKFDKNCISNSFIKNMNKQYIKYGKSYSDEDIDKKKSRLIRYDYGNKSYLEIISGTTQEISKFEKILNAKKFDIAVYNNSIYLNSFYFKGLNNVLKSLNEVKL